MVSNVGLNFGAALNNQSGFGNNPLFGTSNSIGINSLQPINSDYEEDLFMPYYLKRSYIQSAVQQPDTTQAAQIAQSNSASVFTGQPANPQLPQMQSEVPQLPQNSRTSNTFKIMGTTLGVSAPAIASYASKAPIAWKTLALKIPVLGIAGFALGTLVDQLISANKPQKT